MSDHYAQHRSGHLWWRRWHPDHEVLHLLMHLAGGAEFDQLLDETHVEIELAHWSRGQFPLDGQVLGLEWLSQEEALSLAPKLFGVSYQFDDQGRVVWSFASRS